MHTSNLLLLAGLLFSCAAPSLAVSSTSQAQVPSPESHLGRPVGTDFELADWDQVSSYYDALDEASPRVLVEKVGESTLGRDFLVTTISSEANMARLDEIRSMTAQIADPRGLSDEAKAKLLRDCPAVVFVSCSMHSTETAATEFGMKLSYTLATSDEAPYKATRDELVVVVIPTLNPDGLDEVVHWYRENVGGPFEGASLLRLYQHYVGHDNNRDWFGLSQVETRHVTRQIYSVWHPQVYWDVHQQGSTGERFFVPPFRDPLNPNLDAGIITGIDHIGSRALWDMTRAGKKGISTGVSYDMWWNGGNRNVPVRHNIIGLLTEAASVNIASPIFLEHSQLRAPGDLPGYQPSNQFPDPWPGGWWRLADIIDYEMAFASSLFGSVSRERELYLANAMEAAERAIEAGSSSSPKAWLLPPDNENLRGMKRLLDILLLGGVEVQIATADFTADGRNYPKGTLVVSRDQPYGSHVKDLFEVQRYPDGKAPYDVAGWTLPMLFGLRRVEVVQEFEVELVPVLVVPQEMSDLGWGEPALQNVLSGRDGDHWERIFNLVEGNSPVIWRAEGPGAGSFSVSGGFEEPAEITEVADGDKAAVVRDVTIESLPRIGIYSPWSGSMNEGWLRWVFDSYGIPFTVVRNEMIRAGRLEEFLDVLILPSVGGRQLDDGRSPGSVAAEYTLGLEPEGAVAVEEFVRGGGRLIAMQSSAKWAIDLFELPLIDATRGPEAGEFSCPGSILRTVPTVDEGGALAAGLPASIPVFFSRAAAWELDKEADNADQVDVLLRYAPTRLLMSGWIQEPEVIEDKAAWIRAKHGAGELHLFGFRPQYRSWSMATFPLLFRSILLGDK
jgi:hypothetical protein